LPLLPTKNKRRGSFARTPRYKEKYVFKREKQLYEMHTNL
jgi:hypothetical protein